MSGHCVQVQPRFALVHSHARGQPTEAASAARGRRGGHDAVGDGAPPGHARSAASSSRTVTGRECLAASTARLRPQPRGWHGAAPRSDAFRSGTRDPLVTGRKSSSRLPTAWRSPSHGQGETTHTPARPKAAVRPGGGRKTRASSEGLAQNPPASQADVSVEHTNSLCARGTFSATGPCTFQTPPFSAGCVWRPAVHGMGHADRPATGWRQPCPLPVDSVHFLLAGLVSPS